MASHRVTHVCPHCGVENRFATFIGGDKGIKPQPGDIGVCVSCYAPFVLGDDGRPHRPMADEIDDVNRLLDEIPGLHERLRRQHDIDLGGIL